MKKVSILDKIRLAFSEEEAVVEFIEVKTADGVVLKVAKLEEGEVVSLVSGEGDELKEEVSGEAEYTLEDGSKISVDAEGKIITVTAGEEEAPEEAPLEMSVILAAVKEANAEDTAVLLKAVSDLSQVVLDQEARIEAFAKAPAAPKKDAGKKSVGRPAKELSPLQAIAAFRAAQNS